MPGLDEVSRELGRLSGLMEGHGRELRGIKADVGQVQTQLSVITSEGCVKGQSHTDQMDRLEKKVAAVEAGKLTGKDLVKLLGGATGISAVFAAIIESIRHLGK